MTGFELRTSGIGSDRSTNWATTTVQALMSYPEPNRVSKQAMQGIVVSENVEILISQNFPCICIW